MTLILFLMFKQTNLSFANGKTNKNEEDTADCSNATKREQQQQRKNNNFIFSNNNKIYFCINAFNVCTILFSLSRVSINSGLEQ